MKQVIILLFIAFNLSAQTEAELIRDYTVTVKDRAQAHGVNEMVLQQVMLAYLVKLDDKTFEMDFEQDVQFKGTAYQVVNEAAKLIKQAAKTKKNCSANLECWKKIWFPSIDVVPEHPMISTTHHLEDTGLGYFKEVANIENPIVCKDDPRSVCKQLNETEKAIAEKQNLISERNRILRMISETCNSAYADLDKFDPHIVGLEIGRLQNLLQDVNMKIKK